MGPIRVSTAVFRYAGAILACLLLAACASFSPQPIDPASWQDRAITRTKEGLTISAAALGPDEARAVFGVPTFSEGIQPVWLRVTNGRDRDVTLLPLFYDPVYYTPAEAAFIHHGWLTGDINRNIDAIFADNALPLSVPPGTTVEGFLYGSADLGRKALNFVYIGDGASTRTMMVVPVPGLAKSAADTAAIYAPGDIRDISSPAELRRAIESLPCCVSDKDGEVEADPLNFVVIADEMTGLTGLIAGGWDPTEGVTAGTAIETTLSFLFGASYRYSPVSNLYVFGRKQDAAFQIARGDVHERNHLRLWLTPLRFRGTPVWIGGISRDIGVIRSGLGTTHRIDPEVDEERWYLAQSLARAQALKRFAYAGGGPVSTRDAPRSSVEAKNVFYSDGLRIVMELSVTPVPLDEIELIRWAETDDAKPGTAQLPDAAATLAGSEWRPTEIAGKPVDSEGRTFFQFRDEGRVTGSGGCNSFNGTYVRNGETIRIGPLAATKRACIGAAMQTEDAFFAALDRARRYQRQRIDLTLFDENGAVAMKLAQTDAD